MDSAEEFIDNLLYGPQIDNVLVLPSGLSLLDQRNMMPEDMLHATENSSSAFSWLEQFNGPRLSKLKGSISYVGEDGEQIDVEKCGLTSKRLFTVEEKRAELRRRVSNGEELKGLYIKELRYIEKYRHPVDHEHCKSVLKRDVKDFVGVDKARVPIYWDRYSEGVFIGNRLSGSSLHVDQCLWSNIGKNWSGYKIIASWRWGDQESKEVLDKYYGELFSPPISPEARSALSKACKLCLVGPGDVFAFSGANPHMVICVGEELSVTAYESFVNVNPRSIQVFCSTCTDEHWERSQMFDDEFRDLKHDVVDLIDDHLDRWIPHRTKRKRKSMDYSSTSDSDSESSQSVEKKFRVDDSAESEEDEEKKDEKEEEGKEEEKEKGEVKKEDENVGTRQADVTEIQYIQKEQQQQQHVADQDDEHMEEHKTGHIIVKDFQEEEQEPSEEDQELCEEEDQNRQEPFEDRHAKKKGGSPDWQSWLGTHDSFLATHRTIHEELKAVDAWCECVRLLRKQDVFFAKYVDEEAVAVRCQGSNMNLVFSGS